MEKHSFCEVLRFWNTEFACVFSYILFFPLFFDFIIETVKNTEIPEPEILKSQNPGDYIL